MTGRMWLACVATRFLSHGETVHFGHYSLEVRATPGWAA